ncbi:hypothetical protein P154DRAFT_577253 [Amniculicola lignicola CBS 123094]|uniref:Extracellular membrane protein CFEM domain-containing protein n=1 Tax=Amniculicola lignicola CBS 123094 TaxID=1392246 RepID=A0A6A5WB38_9PLEO|nr:hypothetical protein P154DRAFT_577253 [Amniculicola lignicola CBS 123094]
MPSLDAVYQPLTVYAQHDSLAPCMDTCDELQGYNGCDLAACWCKKANLDLRITSLKSCASLRCTFQNMNTQTDLDSLSAIQVQYCIDKGFSPAGMTVPSTVEAATTTAGSDFSVTAGVTTTTARQTSGPQTTLPSDPSFSFTETLVPTTTSPFSASSSNPTSSRPNSSVMSTAAKAGIAIGGTFCILLAIVIVLLLKRRRTQLPPQYMPPPPNNFQNGPYPPPHMAPTPYSNISPYAPPPPIQEPMPTHPRPRTPVSPMEEKFIPVTVARKDAPKALTKSEAGTPLASLAVAHANDPREYEVHGSVPPPRHEVGNDGQITNTVSARGMELDGRPQQYQQSAQGPVYGQELDAGQHGWGQNQNQRQELPGPNQGYGYGGAYELGSGR